MHTVLYCGVNDAAPGRQDTAESDFAVGRTPCEVLLFSAIGEDSNVTVGAKLKAWLSVD